MNAGLGNLAMLQAHLLANSLSGDNRFDVVIQQIGQGVAAAFENFCNRKFTRAVGSTEIFGADRCQFLLSRFPVEAVSKSELKLNELEGFVEQDANFIQSLDLGNGIIYMPDSSDVGPYWAQLRFTYTGGYFFEIKEPADAGYPTAVPAGSALLPEDLRLAWLLQSRAVWTTLDKLGTDVLTAGSSSQFVTGTLSALELVPEVKRMIGKFVRYHFT